MGGCASSTAKSTAEAPKKLNRQKIEEDELTEVDTERLRAEQRLRKAEEDEITRQIYAEKAALKEITSLLIEKKASCESLMDLLMPEELVAISLNEACFRAQKQARRKLAKNAALGKHSDWMLYNNVDGIKEPHMVHLALFMQKVLTTLARIDAIKNAQAQPHSKSDGQLTKITLSPNGAVKVAPITPPSSPAVHGSSRGGSRKTYQQASAADRKHPESRGAEDTKGNGAAGADLAKESFSPFRTSSLDSGDSGDRDLPGLELQPTDAATLNIIEQQRQLEEQFLSSSGQTGDNGNNNGESGAGPPSPPPSPNGSPPPHRSHSSSLSSAPGSPRSPTTGHKHYNDMSTYTATSTATSFASYSEMLAMGASLALRLGELLSPEDEQILTGVQEGTGHLLDNVRSSKSRHSNNLDSLSPEAQQQLRDELLSLQVSTIAPQASYDLTPENLYDYDLPPGLVTLRVARTVLQLYRRGGRLTPKSVHKLLRLGYRSFSKMRNTTHVTVQPGDTLTVVGDLHGQLPDLLHILETAGLPSRTNKFIFNGDFVDRGSYGVEVMCALLALHIAMPEQVILNRGNHEDYAICTVYGFQMECCEKYGDVIFGLFVEIFQQLPLFTIVNEAVIVLHGGLFHTTDASLAELDRIDRSAFSLQDLPEGGETLQPVPRAQEGEYLKQLVRDALWSDPADEEGIQSSVRGAGVSFGPDVTRAFLEANRLQFVVRSHECVRSGYDEPYSGRDKGLLCTIFSASDYGGAGNSAAFLQFRLATPEDEQARPHSRTGSRNNSDEHLSALSAHEEGSAAAATKSEAALGSAQSSEVKFVRNTSLCYTVHYFYVAPNFFDEGSASTLWEHPAHSQTYSDLTALNTVLNAGQQPPPAGNTAEGHTASAEGVDDATAGEVRSSSAGVPLRKANSSGSSASASASGGPLMRKQLLDGTATVVPPLALRRSKSLSAAGSVVVAPDLLAEEEGDGEGADALQVSDRDCVLIGSRTSLRELIVTRLDELRRAFLEADPRGSGVVTKFQWVNVMREVMGLHVRWISLMQLLVLDRHFRSAQGKKMVSYDDFLKSFEPQAPEEAAGVSHRRPSFIAAQPSPGRGLGAGMRTGTESGSGKEGLDGPLIEDEYTALLSEQDKASKSNGAANGQHSGHLAEEVEGAVGSPRDDSCSDAPTTAPSPASHPTSSPSPTKSPGPPSQSRKKVSFLFSPEPEDNRQEDRQVDRQEEPDPSLPSPPQPQPQQQGSPGRKSVSFAAPPAPPPSAAVAEETPLVQFREHNISQELMAVLYIDYQEVEGAFAFFDRDRDGVITHAEFRAACKELNKYLPRGQRIRDIEALLALMDIEETGEIPLNNFFELFRLSEIKLNVAIDEEDTLPSSLHHSGENKDLVRRASAVSMSGYGSFYASGSNKLAVHGVEINVDSEFTTGKNNMSALQSSEAGLNIDI